MHFRRFLFFDLLFLLQLMGLFEDLTGACIYTSLMRAVHKSQLPAAVLLPCILTADGFAPVHGTAETGYKFLFNLHFYPSDGFSAIWADVISSSIPVSL